MTTVSVPGKVHLMGEHAVVYGKPALLAAINKRLTVTVLEGHPNTTGYVAHVVDIVQRHFKTTANLTITIKSDIAEGYHLGSSAAVAVGVVGAVTFFLKKIWNPQFINQLAYEAEKFMHGNPSGGDNTAVTMGGFIWYRKELEFLKSIWQIPLTTKLTKFYLLDTGKPDETTKEMVAYVARRKNIQHYFDENELQTKRVAMALKTNDEEMLIDAMRKGQRSLEAIGVVSKKVIPMIRSIEQHGAAKILGGGGKRAGVGYLLCYAKHQPKDAIPVTLGEEGIRLEGKQ